MLLILTARAFYRTIGLGIQLIKEIHVFRIVGNMLAQFLLKLAPAMKKSACITKV